MNSFIEFVLYAIGIIILIVMIISIIVAVLNIINYKPKKYYRITTKYIKDNHYYIIKARDEKDAERKVRKKSLNGMK